MEKRSLLHKLKMIFPPKERRYFFRLFFLTLIQTVLDFFGVSLILPLVNLILRSDRDTSRWSLLIQRLLPRLDRTQQLGSRTTRRQILNAENAERRKPRRQWR